MPRRQAAILIAFRALHSVLSSKSFPLKGAPGSTSPPSLVEIRPCPRMRVAPRCIGVDYLPDHFGCNLIAMLSSFPYCRSSHTENKMVHIFKEVPQKKAELCSCMVFQVSPASDTCMSTQKPTCSLV